MTQQKSCDILSIRQSLRSSVQQVSSRLFFSNAGFSDANPGHQIAVSFAAGGMVLAAAMGLPAEALAQSTSGPIGFADYRVCAPGEIDVPQALRDAPGGNPDEQEISIQADGIEAAEGQALILTGSAQVLQGRRGVYADRIEYDQENYRALASGDVTFYTANGDEIKAESMNIEVDTFIGDAEMVSIRMVETNPAFLQRRSEAFDEDYSVFAPFSRRYAPADRPDQQKPEKDEDGNVIEEEEERRYYQRARARAASMEILGQDYEILQDAVMTTCPEGNEDVTLSASRVELDHASGIGSAKNMVVRLKSVPIFYFPTVTFPIDDQRKTGFLFPAFGEESDSGFILETPYYINIAPQMDATVTPRLLTERGVQVYGEFRYIADETEGSLKAEYLPGDDLFDDEDRYAVGFDHDQTFAEDWKFEVELQDVSDSDYLRDFANNVDVVASSFVPQRARVSNFGEFINFNARVQSYESVNDEIDSRFLPYDLLPDLNLDLRPQDLGPLELGMQNRFTQFEADDDTRITGSRLRLKPYVSLPLERVYGYIKPKFSVYNLSYSLDNVDSVAAAQAAAAAAVAGDDDVTDGGLTDVSSTGSSSPSATIPVFSLDNEVIFERLFEAGDTPYYQTLQPRLFYVNIPEEADQNDFPIFDTGVSTANSYDHFFRENRFFGDDRIGDTEQLSLGLTSRIINDDTGEQRMKLSVGQIFFLDDRNIQLNPEIEPDTEDTSDFIGEITANLTDDWSVTGFGRYDDDEGELSVLRLGADYYNSPRRNASIAYTDINDSIEQVYLGFDTPLGPSWQLDAAANYSITDEEVRSSAIGVTYDGCCWALKLTTQRYLDGRGEFKNRFLFTLELDDLGQIRSQL